MARYKIDIRGVIIPNDYEWYYRFFGEDCTCPRYVQDILGQSNPGDDIDVYINSGGGVINVGSEIYILLRQAAADRNLKMHITGQACSAASVIACAAWCDMAPTALMMVHCVSVGGVSGNHADMEHMGEVLRTADRAMCQAYVDKTGMSQEDALAMMEHETWLTAEQAMERGLIDAIMMKEEERTPLVAGYLFSLPTSEQMEKARSMIGESGEKNKDKKDVKIQMEYLALCRRML